MRLVEAGSGLTWQYRRGSVERGADQLGMAWLGSSGVVRFDGTRLGCVRQYWRGKSDLARQALFGQGSIGRPWLGRAGPVESRHGSTGVACTGEE